MSIWVRPWASLRNALVCGGSVSIVGGRLNGVLLRAGLVDELHLLVHPVLVGGDTPSFFREPLGKVPAEGIR